MMMHTYERFTDDALESWDFPFLNKDSYIQEFRHKEKQSYFNTATKILKKAMENGESKCSFCFRVSKYKKEVFDLEAMVNEMQDVLRKKGFSVTKNTLDPAKNDGFIYSLDLKWTWK